MYSLSWTPTGREPTVRGQSISGCSFLAAGDVPNSQATNPAGRSTVFVACLQSWAYILELGKPCSLLPTILDLGMCLLDFGPRA